MLFIFILPISYMFFKLGFPPESTFLVSISVAVVAFVFRILLTKKQIPEFSIRQFKQEIIIRSISVVMLSVLIPGLIRINMQAGFIRLMIVTLTSLTMSLAAIYLIGLKSNEKTFFKNAMTALVSKIKR